MKRPTLLIACVVAMLLIGLAAPLVMADDGRRTNATVSFGQWQTEPPLDRFLPSDPNAPFDPNDRFRNEHQLIPHKVEIKAGGAVNFIISGFHQILVYDDGTQPDDFDAVTTPTIPPTISPTPPTEPPGPPLINEPANRIYRGLDPSLQPLYRNGAGIIQDRVEVVHFPKPGTYLVICAVHPHFFNDGMFGFVEVREKKHDDD